MEQVNYLLLYTVNVHDSILLYIYRKVDSTTSELQQNMEDFIDKEVFGYV